MGVIHLAAVGRKPGAVTSALSYLKHNQEKFTGFKGRIIESIILFTSSQIRDGIPRVKECVNNEYGNFKGPGAPWQNMPVLEVVKNFIEKELADIMPKKGSLSVCVVDHNDYSDCFEKIAKTVLKLSPNPKTGKNIWVNLTGGTNILNAALLEAALLSGKISRLYYTFLSDVNRYGDFLKPPSKEKMIFDWREVPIFKMNFDNNHYEVLQILAEKGDWCDEIECLNKLKNKKIKNFTDMDIKSFRRAYLNHMDEQEIDRDNNKNRLSLYGQKVIDDIKNPLFRAIISRGKPTNEDTDNILQSFELEEIWRKTV